MAPPTRRWIGPVAALAIGACAPATSGPAARVTVLPLDAFGVAPKQVATTVARLSRQLEDLGTVLIVPGHETRQALEQLGCRATRTTVDDQVACAARVGEQTGASHAIVGAMGGLGETYVLRLKVVAVGKRAVTRAVEETVFGAQRARGRRALAAVARRLFDPAPRPWYRRWWVWTTLAAVGAVAAITVPLATRERDPYRDITVP